MCQAIRDGGRRCPEHQHHNLAAIKAVAGATGLEREQVAAIFRKCRAGAGNLPDLTPADFHQLMHAIVMVAPKELQNQVENEAYKTFATNDAYLDGASGFATRVLFQNATVAAENLNKAVLTEAARLGITSDEARTIYKNTWKSARKNLPNWEDGKLFTPAAVRKAMGDHLPADRASVIAIEKLRSIVNENPPKPTVSVFSEVDGGSMFDRVGFGDGRLELWKKNQLAFSYKNVTANQHLKVITAPQPRQYVLENLSFNTLHIYRDEEEAAQDSMRHQCASCGQFASITRHACPQALLRQELAEKEAIVENVQAKLALTAKDLPAGSTLPGYPQDENVSRETQLNPPAFTYRSRSPWDSHDSNSGFDWRFDGTPYDVSVSHRTFVNVSQVIDGVRWNSEHVVTYSGQHDAVMEYIADAEIRQLARDSVEGDGGVWFWQVRTAQDGSGRKQAVLVDTTREERISPLLTPNRPRDLSEGFVEGNPRKFPFFRDPLRASPALFEEQRAAQLDELDQMVKDGTADRVSQSNTYHTSSRHGIDHQLQGVSKRPVIKMQLANPKELYTTFEAGRVAIIPVDAIYQRPSGRAGSEEQWITDDHGKSIPFASTPARLIGDVAVRQEEDGTLTVLNDHRTLQCDCARYRRHYHCPHVDHVLRHVANPLQQSLLAAKSVPSAKERHPNLTTGFYQRGWTNLKTDPETGETYVSLVGEDFATPELKYTPAFSGDAGNPLPAPSQMEGPANERVVTVASYLWRAQQSMLAQMSVTNLKEAAVIRAALKRGPVEVPVTLRAPENNTSTHKFTMTGTVRFGQAENPDDPNQLNITHRDLKCDCPDYQRNYDCIHVREVVDALPALLWDRNVSDETATYVAESDDAYYRTTGHWANDWYHMKDGSPAWFIAEAYPDGPEVPDEEVAKNRHIFQTAVQQVRKDLNERGVDPTRIRASTLTTLGSDAYNAASEQWDSPEEVWSRRHAINTVHEYRQMKEQNEKNARALETFPAYREERLNAWEQKEPGYQDNPQAFYDDYRAAQAARASKKAVSLKFEAEGGVTDGVCAPGNRGFGIELEFTIKEGVNRTSALRSIGKELHKAGLLTSERQQDYHTASEAGYTDKWSFEEDMTVAGEMVSPILHDTPEDWEQVRKVCDIVTKHGGVASTKVGAHVNISTGSYERNQAKHRELVRTVNEHEDLLFRLASNPHRGSHRGIEWCKPLAGRDNAGAVPVDIAESRHHDFGFSANTPAHGDILNISASGAANGRVEFRLWDGTLDAAVIQRQVAISAALVDSSEVRVLQEGASQVRPSRRRLGEGFREHQALAGSVVAQEGAEREVPAEQEEGLAQAMGFFDQLFRKQEDRKRAVELLGATRWQRKVRQARD